MKQNPAYCFIRCSRGDSRSDDFVEKNRKILAKLLTKSYQVFTNYQYINSSSSDEEVIYFVIDHSNQEKLGEEMLKLSQDFYPDLSISEAYEHFVPDSVMGKWAMSLISKI